MYQDPLKFSLIKHHHCRRAKWHDYRSICSYLITVTKNPIVPLFSEVCPIGNAIGTKLYPSGLAIEEAFRNWKNDYPHIEIHSYVIMPDHVHVIIRVWKYLDKPVGNYIGSLKGRCTTAYRKLAPFPEDQSLFNPNFNDRILMYENQLDTWRDYIADNPRRLWLMRNCSDHFQRFELSLPDHDSLPYYGNPALLVYPLMIVVKYDSHGSEATNAKHRDECLRVAANGGVLISPFIHEFEKRIGKEAYELGGRFIKIISHPYGRREKPSGSSFDWCAQGIMAYIAKDSVIPYGKENVSRRDCERMNALAALVFRTPLSARIVRKDRSWGGGGG